MIALFDNRYESKLNGMRRLIILIWVTAFGSGFAQDSLAEKTRAFYAALNKGDSTEVRAFFHDHALIKHTSKNGVLEFSLDNFLYVCHKFKSDEYSEDIMRMEVNSKGPTFSYVDVYFQFYIFGSYHRSGVDHLCWTYKHGELKIETIYSANFDWSVAPNDPNDAVIEMDSLMDKWHRDVGIFDYEAYFGFMGDDFIFLGTDPGERWTKTEFAAFSKPYFDNKSTWLFTKKWRNWYFSEDYSMAWFEESLDTWMEECRGSGVLKKINGEWKIVHYNLSVVIENEKMKKFIKLRRK